MIFLPNLFSSAFRFGFHDATTKMKGTGTLTLLGLLVGARAFAPGWPRPARTPGVAATAKGEDGGDAAATDAAARKATLLERVRALRRLQEEDGKIAS